MKSRGDELGCLYVCTLCMAIQHCLITTYVFVISNIENDTGIYEICMRVDVRHLCKYLITKLCESQGEAYCLVRKPCAARSVKTGGRGGWVGEGSQGRALRYLVRTSTSCAELEGLFSVGRRCPKLDSNIMVSCTRWDFGACWQTRVFRFMADVAETGEQTGNMNRAHILVGHHLRQNSQILHMDTKSFTCWLLGNLSTVLMLMVVVLDRHSKEA